MKKSLFCALFALSSFASGQNYAEQREELIGGASNESAYLCANCYWDTGCGAVSTQEVVALGLINENTGLARRDRGPFQFFACGNGRTSLGVLWSEKPCGQTGGLSGIPDNMFDMVGNPQCRFGN
jgi:hypothetical protein